MLLLKWLFEWVFRKKVSNKNTTKKKLAEKTLTSEVIKKPNGDVYLTVQKVLDSNSNPRLQIILQSGLRIRFDIKVAKDLAKAISRVS